MEIKGILYIVLYLQPMLTSTLYLFPGLIIPANCVSALINKLSTSDQSQQLAVQEQQKRQQLHPQSLSHAPNT